MHWKESSRLVPRPLPRQARLKLIVAAMRENETSKGSAALEPVEHNNSSIEKLGDDILLIILQSVKDSHPPSLANARLVSSVFNRLAQYVWLDTLKLDYSRNKGNKCVETKQCLDRIAHDGFLHAIHFVEVTEAALELGEETFVDEDAQSAALDRFRELLPDMTGLKDFVWSGRPMRKYVLDTVAKLSRVRLHITVTGDTCTAWPKDATLGQDVTKLVNLYHLNVRYEYRDAKECRPFMQALKKVLLATPNLGSLTLDVGQPKSGCDIPTQHSLYCGLGFANGERPAPLERLEIIDYPWASFPEPTDEEARFFMHLTGPWMEGYPGTEPEEEYWADMFDWSQLKCLSVPDAHFALTLMSKLTSLEEISISNDYRREPMSQFLLQVPVDLKVITSQVFDSTTLEGILRHGPSLRKLQLHQMERHSVHWNSDAIDCASLIETRDQCPNIEEMNLDLGRNGEWPSEALDTLASFLSLRRLTICFALEKDRELLSERWLDRKLAAPLVTFAAAQELYKYLRAKGASKLKELVVHSGAPPPVGHGLLDPIAFWPYHNSMKFVCRPAVRDDNAVSGKISCECPDLGKQENQLLRGEIEGIEHWPEDRLYHPTAIPMIHLSAKESVAVASNGPRTRREWGEQNSLLRGSNREGRWSLMSM